MIAYTRATLNAWLKRNRKNLQLCKLQKYCKYLVENIKIIKTWAAPESASRNVLKSRLPEDLLNSAVALVQKSPAEALARWETKYGKNSRCPIKKSEYRYEVVQKSYGLPDTDTVINSVSKKSK